LREPLTRLQSIINYEFSDIHLLDIATTHRSVSDRNNERLEFLGDSILGFVIADQLFHKFPTADEGQLSRLRASLVKKEMLSKLGRELSLGKFIKLGQGELKSGGHSRDSILADTVEAIIAAIYLDNGYQKAREFILELYQAQLEQVSLVKGQKDPKTRLQELLQSRKLDLPVYELLEASGPQHKQRFVVSCQLDSLGVSKTGTGTSKRKAEQDAAMQVLEVYEKQQP
jgi:ribonuclease-3